MRQLIQLDSVEITSQQAREINRIPTDINWQKEIAAGSIAMHRELFFTAYNHYKISLSIAKKIFTMYKYHDAVPDNVVTAIMTSYLNICELWGKQHKTTAMKGYLCEAFDYLLIQRNTSNLSSGLRKQLRNGLDKIYTEMVLCMKGAGDLEILAMKKEILKQL